MFFCPECKSDTKVYRSVGNYRYRKCVKCNFKFSTEEVILTRYGKKLPDMVNVTRYGKNDDVTRYGKKLPDMVKTANLKERKKESIKERKKENCKNKILFNNTTYAGIREEDKKRWQEAYPAIDIETEIKKSAEWLIANPKNKKSNYSRFLINWFAKSQDRAGRTGYKKQETLAERYMREKGLTEEELKKGERKDGRSIFS